MARTRRLDGPGGGGVSLIPSEFQLVGVNSPSDVTRRKMLVTTGGALAVPLAGCGDPEDDEEDEDADSPAQDEGNAEEGAQTPTSENDPYAPDDNSTQGSGNETVQTRGPDEEEVDEGGDAEAGEEGDGDAGQGDEEETGGEGANSGGEA